MRRLMQKNMSKRSKAHVEIALPKLLDELEGFYGKQAPNWPVDPYEFIVWWHCGYPPSDAACAAGWEKLKSTIGVEPRALLQVTAAKLAALLKAGGLIAELRAERLQKIAMAVEEEFGGDLTAALRGSLAQARKILKKFPGIGDPGADRILLFAGIAPIAAAPSNCTQVLNRILHGRERESYRANYRASQEAIAAEVAETFDARVRAYLLLKRHGQGLCKRTKPICEKCPVRLSCFFGGYRQCASDRGRPTASASRIR
jgi:endonuclease III